MRSFSGLGGFMFEDHKDIEAYKFCFSRTNFLIFVVCQCHGILVAVHYGLIRMSIFGIMAR